MPEIDSLSLPTCDFYCELLEARPSEECGCPEELWMMASLEVIIHLEPDGTGHILIDAGDWEHDWETTHNGMADLRQKAADFIMTLPMEDDDK